MKTDLYTKVVLTIIAACLLCLVFREVPLVSTAQAQAPGLRNSTPPTDVNIVAIGGKPPISIGSMGVLPVREIN